MDDPDPPNLELALRSLARGARMLLALDFDGVLAPIVAQPDAAKPLARSAQALAELALSPGVRIALVSGRTLEDLRRLSGAPQGAVLVGGHGAQWEWPEPDHRAVAAGTATAEGSPSAGEVRARRHLLESIAEALGAIVAEHPGTAVELKPTGVVLHTRGAAPEVGRAAAAQAWAGPARWTGVYPLAGKEVVDLSVVQTSKGIALQTIRAVLGPAPGEGGVLYIGDDVTDESAFAVLDDALGDVTVKVGPEATAARHRIGDPEAVAEVLSLLAGFRRTP